MNKRSLEAQQIRILNGLRDLKINPKKRKPIKELAELCGVSETTIRERLKEYARERLKEDEKQKNNQNQS